jgi:AraC-like DNA-binding protein
VISPVKILRPSKKLERFVSAFWDWDVPQTSITRLTGRILPSVWPLLVVQYRAPLLSDRRLARGPYTQMIIGVQTENVAVRPLGPVGAFKIRFRPEALPRLLRSSLAEFRDAEVSLQDVLPSSAVSELVERIALARHSEQRVTIAEEFLVSRLRTDGAVSLVEEAAARLRTQPALTVDRLCSDLGIGRRQLSQRFGAVFGVTPKRFAKLQRLNHVLAMRRRGFPWADIACACGFTDQAHLIRDFSELVGRSPEDFFRTTQNGSVRALNDAIGRAGFCNTFAQDDHGAAPAALAS